MVGLTRFFPRHDNGFLTLTINWVFQFNIRRMILGIRLFGRRLNVRSVFLVSICVRRIVRHLRVIERGILGQVGLVISGILRAIGITNGATRTVVGNCSVKLGLISRMVRHLRQEGRTTNESFGVNTRNAWATFEVAFQMNVCTGVAFVRVNGSHF